jgi:hypothetical protein
MNVQRFQAHHSSKLNKFRALFIVTFFEKSPRGGVAEKKNPRSRRDKR